MLTHLYDRPGFLLRRAHQISVALFERYCKDFPLTPPQYGVLYILNTIQKIDQGTLARALGYDKVTTSHIVRGLETRQLLQKTTDAYDRRRSVLALTNEGKQMVRLAMPLANQAHAHMLSPLNTQEQQTLIFLLDKLCSQLEEEARAPMTKINERE